MKKELLIASVFAATVAGAGTVTTSNAMAYVPVNNAPCALQDSKRMYMVVAPFEGYDSDQISVADVIQTAGLAAGDELLLRKEDGKGYNVWTLQADKTWKPVADITFSASGMQSSSGTSPNVPLISRGQAFWVKTAATSLSLFGNSAGTTAKTVAIPAGWSMVGSTVPTGSVKISLINDCSTGDLIMLADGTRYQKKSAVWKKYANKIWADVVDTDAIPAGTAFWYMTQSGKSLTF